MKKIFALVLALLLMVAVFCVTSSAEGEPNYMIRVSGLKGGEVAMIVSLGAILMSMASIGVVVYYNKKKVTTPPTEALEVEKEEEN